jgi:hypothetical protein
MSPVAVRLVHAEPGHVGASVVARAAALAQTRSVLIVSARLPGPVLRRALDAAGADLARIFVLDVTSHGLPPSRHDPEHEAYVPGPAMLELIAKRTEQIIRAKAERPATVLVDDLATFSHYNPPEALVEILRHILATRAPQNEHEYVLSGGEPARLVDQMRNLLDEECDILPSGDLALRPPPPGRTGGPVDLSRNVHPKR